MKEKCGKEAVRAGKGFTLFSSNEDKDDVIKTVESLERSGLLIEGATEIVKHEIKIRWISWAMMAPITASSIALMGSSLISLLTSLLINVISGKGPEGEFLLLLALPLIMKVLEKGVRRAG